MESLLQKSEALTHFIDSRFKRYLYAQINWDNRLIGIKGARGTGKTTLLIQYLKALDKSPREAAYFSLDDLYFTSNSLTETAERFYRSGGKFLLLDEVHKYPNWAAHIKNLYDFYPDLKITFTGSSIIDIAREESDLSRRVRMYELHGLSYREYLELMGIIQLPKISLEEILSPERKWRKVFPPDFRPLQHLEDYLKRGYYPFFAEDPDGLHSRLEQLVRMVIEYDMAELHDFDIRNARKMLQLLYVLAMNVPFKPNITSLAEKSGLHRNTINNYLHFLEQAKMIRMLYPSGISVAALQKPEKIYLENTNLSFAISGNLPDTGNLRETFFANQLAAVHKINYPAKGDFIVNNKWVFEVGGKNKTNKQIKDLPNSFRVVDDMEYPVSDALPLWIFGFLY